MLWRGLVYLTAVLASMLLAWAGFSYIWEGIGLNPYIAFPAAVIIHVAAYAWLAYEAEQADQHICDYLEWLEGRASAVQDLEAEYQFDIDLEGLRAMKAVRTQIQKSLQFWDDIADRHL